MTVSVLAVDVDSGAAGVATASFVLAVGSRVPVVEAGGVAVVQGGAPLVWKRWLRAELAERETATDIVRHIDLLVGAGRSQVAVVDHTGGVAVHCGATLEPHVTVAAAAGLCVVGNLMERPEAADVAADAFAAAASVRGTGPATLADRLLAALVAIDACGGDVRGRQSAALTVLGADGTGEDLRVDDSRDPVRDLSRLHVLHAAQSILDASRGPEGRFEDAELAVEAHMMAPDDRVCLGGAALALIRAGWLDDALPLVRRMWEQDDRTPERMERLVQHGRLDARAWEAVLAQVRPATP